MNIEPLITRIKALDLVMEEFQPSELVIMSLFSQAIKKLAPVLSSKDFEVITDAIHTQVNVVQRLYETIIELNNDIASLEIEVKNE